MAKIRKIYDQTIKPDGSKTTIYPITSTRAVYTPEGVTLDSYIKDGYFHGADLAGYKVMYGVSELPLEETPFGYLIDSNLYVWVGTNGNTLDGKYQNCGPFKGPKGDTGQDGMAGLQGIQGPQGPVGPQGVQGQKGDSGVSLGEVELSTSKAETTEGMALDASVAQYKIGFTSEEEVEEVPSNYYKRWEVDSLIDAQRIAREQKELEQDTEIASFENTINDVVENYKPIVINGNVNNAPDEEDITSKHGLLKLKNRPNLNGMGYCILRRDKSFAEQVPAVNTIYEIRYDFDLDNGSLPIPSGCTILFNGGSLSNGTIIGNGTTIIAESSVPIFHDMTLSGTFVSSCAVADWFDDSNDKRMLDSLLKFDGAIVLGKDASYSIDAPIAIKGHSYVNMNGATITMTQANKHGIFIQYANDVELYGGRLIGYGLNGNESSEFGIWVYDSKNVNIHDMYISNFSGDGVYIGYGWEAETDVNHIQNIHISKCVVDAVARNGIGVASGDNIFIEDCVFKNITKTAPRAGIDIEPETGVAGKLLHIDNVHVNNCSFYGCANCVQVYSSDFNYDAGTVYLTDIYCQSGGTLYIENVKYQGGLNVFVSNITMNQPSWVPIYIKNPSNTRIVSIDGIHLSGYSETRSAESILYYDKNYGAITIFAQKLNGGQDRDDLGRVMISNVNIEDNQYNDLFDNIVSIGFAAEEFSDGTQVFSAQSISDVSIKDIKASARQIHKSGYCSYKNTLETSTFVVEPCMIKYGTQAASSRKVVARINGEDINFSFKVQCFYKDFTPQYFSGEVTLMAYGNTLTLSTSRGTTQIDQVRLVKDGDLVYLDFQNAKSSEIQYSVFYESMFGDIIQPLREHTYSGSEVVLATANL